MVKGLVEVAGTSLREADPQANIAYHVATIGGHAAVNSFIQKQGKKFADDILLRNMESRRPLDLMFLNHHADLMRINRPSCNDKAFAKLEEEDDALLAHDGKHKLPPDTVFPTLHSAVLHGSTAHVINFLNTREGHHILPALVNERCPSRTSRRSCSPRGRRSAWPRRLSSARCRLTLKRRPASTL